MLGCLWLLSSSRTSRCRGPGHECAAANHVLNSVAAAKIATGWRL